MISGFLSPSPSPKSNLFIFGDTRIPENNQETSMEHVLKCFLNLIILDFQNFDIFRKDRHRTMMKIRLIKPQKSLIWDQDL